MIQSIYVNHIELHITYKFPIKIIVLGFVGESQPTSVSLLIHLLGHQSYSDSAPHLFATVAVLDGFQSWLVIPCAAVLG